MNTLGSIRTTLGNAASSAMRIAYETKNFSLNGLGTLGSGATVLVGAALLSAGVVGIIKNLGVIYRSGGQQPVVVIREGSVDEMQQQSDGTTRSPSGHTTNSNKSLFNFSLLNKARKQMDRLITTPERKISAGAVMAVAGYFVFLGGFRLTPIFASKAFKALSSLNISWSALPWIADKALLAGASYMGAPSFSSTKNKSSSYAFAIGFSKFAVIMLGGALSNKMNWSSSRAARMTLSILSFAGLYVEKKGWKILPKMFRKGSNNITGESSSEKETVVDRVDKVDNSSDDDDDDNDDG